MPDYAQFDNSMVFQGGMLPDTLGKVIRCCLSLGAIPVPRVQTSLFHELSQSFNQIEMRRIGKERVASDAKAFANDCAFDIFSDEKDAVQLFC